MATSRRPFTPEFKAEALKLVPEQGRSFVDVARGNERISGASDSNGAKNHDLHHDGRSATAAATTEVGPG